MSKYNPGKKGWKTKQSKSNEGKTRQRKSADRQNKNI
jgi:hypothetical protein